MNRKQVEYYIFISKKFHIPFISFPAVNLTGTRILEK